MEEIEKERLREQTRVQTVQFAKTGFAIYLKVMLVILVLLVVGMAGCAFITFGALQHTIR